MSVIYLLRHGRTAWNKGLIFRGRADVGLDEYGRAQANCANRALAEVELSQIYCSPLSRAVQTAEPVAAEKGLNICETPQFLDIDYGQWTGKSQQEVEQSYADMSRLWLESPVEVEFPDGESLRQVSDRAFGKLAELAAGAGEQPFLIVSHRVVLKVLVCAALEMPLSRFWQVQVDTASLTVLSWEQGRFTLRSLNDTCHLKELGGEGESVDF